MKENTDKRARARVSTVAVGDTVLVRQRKRNKFTTRFDPSPFEVMRIKGMMVTAARNEKYITRNISQFKKIPSLLKELEGEESDISDDDISEDGDNPPDTHHMLHCHQQFWKVQQWVRQTPPLPLDDTQQGRKTNHIDMDKTNELEGEGLTLSFTVSSYLGSHPCHL